MLEFEPLTLADLAKLSPYIIQSRSRSCDDTIADVFMWRDYFKKSYAIAHDSLIIKMNYFNTENAYMMPLGGDTTAALEAIREDCLANGTVPTFVAVTESSIPAIEAVFGEVERETNRDWSDYIYDADAFIAQKGKKFSSQRNHVNRFIRSYPGYVFEEIRAEHLDDIRAFFEEFNANYNKDNPMVAEEAVKIPELLENYEAYGQRGALMRLGDIMLGFTVGEVIGDTLIIHIEKARTDIPGIYPTLSQHFADMMKTDELKWLNREEDLGDPGLRRSKEGYNPTYLLDKYIVRIKTR